MKRHIVIAVLIGLCLSTTSCVCFFGNWAAVGFGERIVEYQDDGKTVKKETTKSKSLLADIVNFVFNRGE